MNCKLLEKYTAIHDLIQNKNRGPTATFRKHIRKMTNGAQSESITVACEIPDCNHPVVIKTIAQSKINDTNGAGRVEATVARAATTLVLDGFSPNIVLLYDAQIIQNKTKTNPTIIHRSRSQSRNQSRNQSKSKRKARGRHIGGTAAATGSGVVRLFYELCDGTLTKWTATAHSEKEWFAMLFQVIHGLMALHQIKIMHGDLHDANVLFVNTTQNATIGYKVNNQRFRVPCFGKVFKIHDFGNSYAQETLGVHHGYRIRGSNDPQVPKPPHHSLFRPDHDLIKLFEMLYLQTTETQRRRIPNVVKDFMYDVMTDRGKSVTIKALVDAKLKQRYVSSGPTQRKYIHSHFLDKIPPESGILNKTSADLHSLLLFIGNLHFTCDNSNTLACLPHNFDLRKSQQPHCDI